MADLYDLRDNFKNAKDSMDFINKLVDEYCDLRDTHQPIGMIHNKFNYIIGVVDALYFLNGITQEEYTNWYKYFGL
jgi:hypothetical protein